VKKSIDQKVKEIVLRWYRHMERMEHERVVKKAYMSEFDGRRRSRSRRCHMVHETM